ncbi:MAG: hypothetical protein ACLR02_10090 [Clostridium sp.]
MDKKEVLEKKIETTERLINDLQNELNGLKEQKDILDKEENKLWKPNKGETYFSVWFDGNPRKYIWVGDNEDKGAYEIGNCVKTAKEAEDMAFCVKLYAKLKKFAKENNEWEKKQEPYIYRIVCDNNIIFADYSRKTYSDFGDVSFSSKDLCEKAIEKFKDDLHKYFQIKTLDRKINN